MSGEIFRRKNQIRNESHFFAPKYFTSKFVLKSKQMKVRMLNNMFLANLPIISFKNAFNY